MSFFLEIAHRGIKNRENTISGILKASSILPMVEIDVRYNTNRDIILCHDREDRNDNRNDTLIQLLDSSPDWLNLMIDIKAFGIDPAKSLGTDIHQIVSNYPKHRYHLCSFNEFCVKTLLDLRRLDTHKIGVISSGVPLELFNSIDGIDFVSLDYNIIRQDIVEIFHQKNLMVYTWTVNDKEMQMYAKNICNVDGIIYDVFD